MKLLNKDNGLDEMQMQRRNKIGHQTMAILIIAFLIDNFLYNMGIEWLDYPKKNMIFIWLALLIYTIRLFISGANEPRRKPSKIDSIIAWVLMLLTIITAVICVLISDDLFESKADSSEDNSAIGLLISITALVVFGIISLIRYIRDRKNDDE